MLPNTDRLVTGKLGGNARSVKDFLSQQKYMVKNKLPTLLDKKFNKTGFAARIAELVRQFGGQQALESRTGVSQQTISEWMRGNRIPSTAKITEIATSLDVDVSWLLYGREVKISDLAPLLEPLAEDLLGQSGKTGSPHVKIDKIIRKLKPKAELDERRIRALLESALRGLSFIAVPKAEARLSAGQGLVVLNEDVEEKDYHFRAEWLRAVCSRPENCVLLDVEGDSMHPTLMDGDTVLVDQGRTTLRDGHIYAIAFIGEDAVYAKRIRRAGKTMIEVISDNKEVWKLQMVNAGDLRIIGEIMWLARDLRKHGRSGTLTRVD